MAKVSRKDWLLGILGSQVLVLDEHAQKMYEHLQGNSLDEGIRQAYEEDFEVTSKILSDTCNLYQEVQNASEPVSDEQFNAWDKKFCEINGISN